MVDINEETIEGLRINRDAFPMNTEDYKPHFEYIPSMPNRPWEKYRLRGIYGKSMMGFEWKGFYQSHPWGMEVCELFKHRQNSPIHKTLANAAVGIYVPPDQYFGAAYPLKLPRRANLAPWVPRGRLSQINNDLETVQELCEVAS